MSELRQYDRALDKMLSFKARYLNVADLFELFFNIVLKELKPTRRTTSADS